MEEKILVTGSSSGFGALMTRALIEAGHSVAASMRDIEGRNLQKAAAARALGAHVVEIDVTDNESVERGVQSALDSLGGLTALVNNAGLGVIGLQEQFTDEDFKRLVDINVFGVQRMNRAVLPGFREQQKGLLVHISSLLGRITLPFYGPYNASKWALEALAENYRTELSSFGIETCIIEPGGYATEFSDNLMRPSDRSRDHGYGDMAQAPEAGMKAFHQRLLETPQQDPNDVATALVEVVGAKPGERPFRTVVDKLGMGAGVEPYNAALEKLTETLYETMGMDQMLHVKT